MIEKLKIHNIPFFTQDKCSGKAPSLPQWNKLKETEYKKNNNIYINFAYWSNNPNEFFSGKNKRKTHLICIDIDLKFYEQEYIDYFEKLLIDEKVIMEKSWSQKGFHIFCRTDKNFMNDLPIKRNFKDKRNENGLDLFINNGCILLGEPQKFMDNIDNIPYYNTNQLKDLFLFLGSRLGIENLENIFSAKNIDGNLINKTLVLRPEIENYFTHNKKMDYSDRLYLATKCAISGKWEEFQTYITNVYSGSEYSKEWSNFANKPFIHNLKKKIADKKTSETEEILKLFEYFNANYNVFTSTDNNQLLTNKSVIFVLNKSTCKYTSFTTDNLSDFVNVEQFEEESGIKITKKLINAFTFHFFRNKSIYIFKSVVDLTNYLMKKIAINKNFYYCSKTNQVIKGTHQNTLINLDIQLDKFPFESSRRKQIEFDRLLKSLQTIFGDKYEMFLASLVDLKSYNKVWWYIYSTSSIGKTEIFKIIRSVFQDFTTDLTLNEMNDGQKKMSLVNKLLIFNDDGGAFNSLKTLSFLKTIITSAAFSIDPKFKTPYSYIFNGVGIMLSNKILKFSNIEIQDGIYERFSIHNLDPDNNYQDWDRDFIYENIVEFKAYFITKCFTALINLKTTQKSNLLDYRKMINLKEKPNLELYKNNNEICSWLHESWIVNINENRNEWTDESFNASERKYYPFSLLLKEYVDNKSISTQTSIYCRERFVNMYGKGKVYRLEEFTKELNQSMDILAQMIAENNKND